MAIRLKTKPRIVLIRTGSARGMWRCMIVGSYAEFGKTPHEAYERWKRWQWLTNDATTSDFYMRCE